MAEHKDVISIIVPGALSLGALLLVFAGFALRELSDLRTYPQRDLALPMPQIRRLQCAVRAVAVVVILAMATSALGVGWLLGWAGIYVVVVAMFLLTLGMAAVVALDVFRRTAGT
ncbi:MAG: hypothetical protein Q8Q00_08115 [Dehalococcoidia bacterium]|nr:hypothetical protein [Dehalococcoidia bacterium]